MILLFSEFIIVYAIGFLAGYLCSKTEVQGATKTLTNTATQIFDKRIKPGIIRRPSVVELNERKIPQRVKEGREAMRETLETIPELQEHKAAIEEYNK